jgi:hypothetical protein
VRARRIPQGIDVVVGGERAANLVERDIHPPEIRFHPSQSPRPADVDEQARGPAPMIQ